MKVLVASSTPSLALAVPCLCAQSTSFGTYGDTSVVPGPGSTPVDQLTSNPGTTLLAAAGILWRRRASGGVGGLLGWLGKVRRQLRSSP
jgi:hypothetical protein